MIQSTFARQSTTLPKVKKDKEAKDEDKEKSIQKTLAISAGASEAAAAAGQCGGGVTRRSRYRYIEG